MSQTCCSGGVPLGGNVGFASYENRLYQFDLSYDLNVLSTLFNESEVLQDNSRLRSTQSISDMAGGRRIIVISILTISLFYVLS